MNILVTGDTGFIGSFLVKKLEKLGHAVEGLNSKNGDIKDINCVNKAVRGKKAVFHLAGLSQFVEAESKPTRSLELNVNGTQNVAMACRIFEAKLIFTSSCFVYGISPMFPTSEAVELYPEGFYGLHKKLAEDVCDPYNDFIVRLGSVYGPSEQCHCVVNKFIQFVKAKKEIPMFQNEQVTRDYIYVDDVVDALILGLDNVGIYNVGSGVETSIKKLLESISKVLNIKYETINMEKSIPGELKKVWLDISKIKSLGWEPKVSLEDGIKRCKDA